MTKENSKRQENETIKDWIKRTAIKDDGRLLKKWKHRQKYEWFCGFVFKVRVRYYSIKRRLKTILKLCAVGRTFYCQRDIEGELICYNQCDHCKEYYKPLEQ